MVWYGREKQQNYEVGETHTGKKPLPSLVTPLQLVSLRQAAIALARVLYLVVLE